MTRFLLFSLTLLLACAPLAQAQMMPVTTTSDDARTHLEQGRARMVQADFDGAREHLDAALVADPSFGLAHMYRAVASSGAVRDEHMRLASAARVSDGERQMIESYAAHMTGDHDRELALLNTAAATAPSDPYPLFGRGFELYFLERYDEAIADFRQILTIDPNFAGAYNGLGYAAMEMGDTTTAESAFRDYIRTAPDDANPYDSFGEFLLSQARLEEAEAQFEIALTKDPDFDNSAMNLARVAMERSDLRFEQAAAEGDADAIAALYTPNAIVMASGSPPIQGRDAIRDHFAAIMASGVDGVDVQTVEVTRFGTTAIRRSNVVISAGGQVVDHAKAMEVWRLIDGEWLYSRDMYSSNGPVTDSTH